MPAHTILSSGTVVIGASADPSDLIEAMRAAARGNRTIRLHAVRHWRNALDQWGWWHKRYVDATGDNRGRTVIEMEERRRA
jgi:hypothetical protein